MRTLLQIMNKHVNYRFPDRFYLAVHPSAPRGAPYCGTSSQMCQEYQVTAERCINILPYHQAGCRSLEGREQSF